MVILELDSVLDAVWEWEVSRYGQPADKWHGRPVYEAVIELQEWLIQEDTNHE